MKRIIILAMCLTFVLTACKQPNVPTENDSNNKGNNSTVSNGPNTNASSNSVYIEIDANTSAEYKAAITAYNKFLSGGITARRSDGTSYNVLQYGKDGKGIVNFALGDVNKDDVPELFIHGDHYAILGFNGNYLAEWYDSMSWQAISLLENGDVLDSHLSIGVTYNYITFNANGIEKFVSFTKPAEGEPDQTFYFEENSFCKKVSKAEWEQLTKPYFEQAKKTVELKWTKWEKKNNHIISNDKPTVSIPEPLKFDFSAKAKAQNPLTTQEVRAIFEPLIKKAVEIQETIINDCGDFEVLDAPTYRLGETYYTPIKNDKLKSISDVWDYVYTSYTKEAAERIFGSRLDQKGTPRFLEKDGILYYNYGGHGHYMEYFFDTLEIIEQYDDTVVISVDYVTFGDGESEKSVFVISSSEGAWKMCNAEHEATYDLKKQFLK